MIKMERTEQLEATGREQGAVQPALTKPLRKRNDQMDNLRCLLIFAVVFGHLLELLMGKGQNVKLVYLLIYSFHMPLFAFVSGVFAKYDPIRIRNRMIYPYVIFQTLYLLFANNVLEKETEMQYTTPYWLLWYLFAMIVWNLVLPLFQIEGQSIGKKLLLLLFAVVAGILIGFDNKAGYYLSFSRIVEFFPFFLLGVYYRQLKSEGWNRTAALWKHVGGKGKKLLKGILFLLVCAILMELVRQISGNMDEIRYTWLYGSMSYENADYSWHFRVISMGVALLWLLFFLLWMPAKRIPLISHIGANTMPVYLLHGFVIKLLDKAEFFDRIAYPKISALLLAVLLVLIFSWTPLVRALGPLFRWDWGRRGTGAGRKPGFMSKGKFRAGGRKKLTHG